ncbi:MAG: hypothetical protein ACREHF_11950 [Rhizomicrobium sp.]
MSLNASLRANRLPEALLPKLAPVEIDRALECISDPLFVVFTNRTVRAPA